MAEAGNVGKDEITGYVYLDGYSGVKGASNPNGRMDGNEDGIQGVYVYLKLGNSIVDNDITDANGKYILQVPSRDTEYTVEFKYDGVNYEATTTGSGSPVAETATTRTSFNNKFTTINKGKSNGVSSLTYFTKNQTNNNPKYSGRTWILQTLDYNSGNNYHTVKSNYATTATTTFSMNNEVQYHYVTNSHSSSCTPPSEESEGSCSHNDSVSGTTWSDYTTLSTGHTCSCNSSFTYYTNEKSNYFLEAIVGNGGESRRWLNHETYKTSAQRDAYETKGSNSYQLNFGLLKREVDLSLVNDLKEVEVSINGQETTYDYADIPIRGDTVNIGNINSNVRRSYLLELTQRDFLYGVRGTGLFTNQNSVTETNEEFIASNATGYYYDKLEIIATYRIALNNQSSTTATINSISYYYDENYEFLGVNKGSASSENSATVAGTSYYRRDITGLNIVLGAGEQETVEVTLRMRKVSNVIQRKTYSTIAEIISYSTTEGKVDIDSAPDTAGSESINNFEDDTDIAPGLTLRENNDTRTISGNVFLDERTEINLTNLNEHKFGDGIKSGIENGVTDAYVQLIEIRDNKYYVWQEKQVEPNGNYLFDNFVPGDYMIRFFYKSEYDGKTVKSTKDNFYEEYQRETWYNEYYEKATRKIYSVARDNEARRLDVISQTVEITKLLGEELANGKFDWMFADTSKIKLAVASETGKEISSRTRVDGTLRSYNQFKQINFGIQEMPKTAIELQKHIMGMRVTANDGTTIVDAETYLRDIIGGRIIEFLQDNIRKGLTAIGASRDERGYWRLETDIEEVLAGATLELVYTYSAKNVGEIDYISTYLAEKFENLDAKGYRSNHDNNPATPDIYIEGYNDELNACAEAIRTVIGRDGYNSAIGTFLGSTYYTGVPTENVSIVKTHVGKIEDYINNDLKFTEVNSSDFTENKTESEHRNSGMSDEDIDKLSEEYKDKKEKYDAIVIDDSGTLKVDKNVKINSVVVSKYDMGKLLPNESRTQTIILESNGKLTSTGVLDFPSNIAQIKTAYSNPMGRRDVYSIPGNLVYISISDEHESLRDGLDDTDINQFRNAAGNEIDGNIEPDSFWAETVEITKPTGENKQLNIALAISITAGIAILGIGIFTIKKYVL